jgi:LPXTG-site transpeptidase (sortase) family protein
MKYRYDKHARHPGGYKFFLLVPLGLFLFGSIYLLSLLSAPRFVAGYGILSENIRTIEPANIPLGEHQIIIPKIGVNIDFLTGDDRILEKAAWHRLPEQGNPEIGGNFIISAHRFNIGWTPEKTRQKSPFYNINQLDPGDVIYVDFKGTRYTYEVNKRYTVKPDAMSVESPSDEAKLTLYSCTFKGARDGREVIEAMLNQSLTADANTSGSM